MGYYRCGKCNILTGIPLENNRCKECFATMEHCTCGSGGHPRRCFLHPDQYYLHCFDLDIINILESNEEELNEQYESTFGKKPYKDAISTKSDLIVERAGYHLINRRDKDDE